MKIVDGVAADQKAHWNGAAGSAWVEFQELLDRIFRPAEDLLANAVAAASAKRVLDIGCGTGSTSIAAARAAGKGGRCLGIDISEPMIAAARGRAAQAGAAADFVCADAQSYAFAPASFDRIISRFGVMFFEDPVAAFANLRRAASEGAGLHLLAWRDPAENPFMTAAERAAAPLLPDLPPRPAGAPGQFAFADSERVEAILREGGWAGIEIRSFDFECVMPENDLTGYISRLGPLGRILPELDQDRRTELIRAVRPAFDSFVQGDEVRFVAACWAVSAQAGRSSS